VPVPGEPNDEREDDFVLLDRRWRSGLSRSPAQVPYADDAEAA
jgi:hypothetical protein